jgi:hypothetical protein
MHEASICGTGGMMLAREKRSVGGGGGCVSATLSTTNPAWIGRESNADLHDERTKPSQFPMAHFEANTQELDLSVSTEWT